MREPLVDLNINNQKALLLIAITTPPKGRITPEKGALCNDFSLAQDPPPSSASQERAIPILNDHP